MKKSEFILAKKIFLFIFGLTNVIPSRISIYDWIVAIIESNNIDGNPFSLSIKIGIIAFRLLVLFATLYELYSIYKYNKKYKIIT